MNKWRKFIELSARERLLLSQSLVLLPFAALALSVMGLGRYQRLIDRFSRGSEPDVARDERSLRDQVRKTARLVEAAGRYGPYRARCLPQSLTLWWLLRRQGVESKVRFGARKNGRRIEAHAWVEFEGTPVNDSTDVSERFKPFEPAVAPEEVKSQ
jgi:hypothetical protein